MLKYKILKTLKMQKEERNMRKIKVKCQNCKGTGLHRTNVSGVAQECNHCEGKGFLELEEFQTKETLPNVKAVMIKEKNTMRKITYSQWLKA